MGTKTRTTMLGIDIAVPMHKHSSAGKPAAQIESLVTILNSFLVARIESLVAPLMGRELSHLTLQRTSHEGREFSSYSHGSLGKIGHSLLAMETARTHKWKTAPRSQQRGVTVSNQIEPQGSIWTSRSAGRRTSSDMGLCSWQWRCEAKEVVPVIAHTKPDTENVG